MRRTAIVALAIASLAGCASSGDTAGSSPDEQGNAAASGVASGSAGIGGSGSGAAGDGGVAGGPTGSSASTAAEGSGGTTTAVGGAGGEGAVGASGAGGAGGAMAGATAATSASSSGASSSSSTGSGGGPTACSDPVAPSQETVLSLPVNFHFSEYPHMVTVNGVAFAVAPFDWTWNNWYRWKQVGWSLESVPWPSGVNKPWVTAVQELATGDLLLRFQTTNGNSYPQHLTVFDGTSLSTPVTLPSAWTPNVKAMTRTPDGVFHLLTQNAPGDPVWSLRSGGANGFGPASPVPIPSSASVAFVSLTDGRLELFFTETGHLKVIHAIGGGPWSSALDLTPTWAVGAASPRAFAARAGGVVVGVTGVSNNYTFPYVWRSADGVVFDGGEYADAGLKEGVRYVSAHCYERPIVVTSQGKMKTRASDGSWNVIASSTNLMWGGRASVLSDGRTVWGWNYENSSATQGWAVLRATP